MMAAHIVVEPILAAVGVLSGGGTTYQKRRDVVRQAWATDPPPAIAVAFVLRCGGLPADAPERSEPLVLCTEVASSEARFRGPLLALLAWFRHAELAYPSASFLCKADDDVFVHLPSILSHLRAIPPASTPYAIYGTISWWHVIQEPGKVFQFNGFGSRHLPPRLVGRCSEANVTCDGAFPFPTGPFFGVGRKLAAALIAAPGVAADQVMFGRLPAGHKIILEDAWLGSAVWRHVGVTAPVQMFALGHPDRLYYDKGQCHVTTDLVIFHMRYKQLNRALVLRHFLSLHSCAAPVRWARGAKQDCCGGAGLFEGDRLLPTRKHNSAGKGDSAGNRDPVVAGGGSLGGVPSSTPNRGRMLPPPGGEVHPWREWHVVPDFDACLPSARTVGAGGVGGARGGGVSAVGGGSANGLGIGGGAGGGGGGGARAALATVPTGVYVDLRNTSELRRLGVFELLPAEARASTAALEEWLRAKL